MILFIDTTAGYQHVVYEGRTYSIAYIYPFLIWIMLDRFAQLLWIASASYWYVIWAFLDGNVKDPPFGYPPKSDELISSVIELLTKTAEECEETPEICVEDDEKLSRDGNEVKNEEAKELFERKQNEKQENKNPEVISGEDGLDLETDVKVNLERENSEKDSLDGSPRSRRSFIQQEEDDSGISMVDENDILQEATITNSHHFEAKKECKFQVENDKKDDNKLLEGSHSGTRNKRTETSPQAEKKTFNSEPELKDTKPNQNYGKLNQPDGKYTRSSGEHEIKYKKSSNFESEQDSSIGWQTSHKRMSRKRQGKEYERMQYVDDSNCTESRVNPRETTSRRSTARNKGRLEKADEYSKTAERHSNERGREKGAWTNKRGDESDSHESPKRSARRGALPSRKSESKYTKSTGREKYGEKNAGKTDSAVQNAKPPANVFSYRDALLKAGSKGEKSYKKKPPRSIDSANMKFDQGLGFALFLFLTWKPSKDGEYLHERWHNQKKILRRFSKLFLF